MKRNIWKRILAMLLVCMMLMSNLPSTFADVLAADMIEYTIKVTDGRNPVSGAKVKLTATGGSDLSGKTDTDGKVQFEIDKTCEYQYSVSKLGFDDTQGILNVSEQSCTIVLTEKQTIAVSGTVKNPEQIAVANAKISITGYNTYQTTTDGSGTFLVEGVYAGENYQLSVITDTYKKVEKPLSLTSSNDIILEKKEASTVTFVSESMEIPFGSTPVCNATSNHGATVKYSSSDTAIVTVDTMTGKITPVSLGTATIIASTETDDFYLGSSTECTVTVTIGEQQPLVWEKTIPQTLTWKDEFSNRVTGGSGSGEITYASSDETVAKVDHNGILDILKPGDVTITATKAGDAMYHEVAASYTITVKRAQYVTDLEFAKTNEDNIFTIAYEEEFVNTASGGSGQSVQYSSSNPEIAVVDSSGKVTTVNVGDVIITATCPENNQYEKQEISYRLVITAAEQSVEFAGGTTNIPAIIYGDEYQNEATAKTEISYTSSDSSIATVDAEGKIDTLKSGTVTITATAEKTEKYEQASSSYTLTIHKADQNITFEKIKEDELEVTFNDNNNIFINIANSDKGVTECAYHMISGPATVKDENSGEIEINGAGTIVVGVDFVETDCYNSANNTYTLYVKKDSQEIAFENASYTVTSGENMDTPNMAAPVGEFYGTSAITYSIVSDSNQIIEQLDTATGKVTLSYQTGTATIRATKAEDANYLEATAEYTITVQDWDYAEQLYILTGEKTNDSGWYTGNVSVKAAEGYSLSYKRNRKEADWKEILQDAVTEDGKDHEISFYVKDNNSGYISEQKIEKVKKDTVSPSASIKIKELNVWEKFLTIITFGMWESEKAEFVIERQDDTSKVEKVEYFIDMDTTEIATVEALDAIKEWETYSPVKENAVDKNNIFVIYAKVTDIAGNYTYASTNGIVFDGVAPEVSTKVITDTTNNTDIHTKDVEIEVTAVDAAPYSGIQKVSYVVKYNDQESDPVVVYDVKNETYTDRGPKYEDLKETIVRTIVIDAETYNYDGVEVEFTVLDNAGNKSTISQILNINVTDPAEIQVIFEDSPEYVNLYEDVEYYNEVRTAQIEIKGRKSVFVTPDVTVTAQNAEGKDVVDTWEISKWESVIDGTNPDETLHKATITFNQNAVYNFTVDYTDAVGRSVDTYDSPVFVVDQNDPQAKITVKEHTWTKLLEKLTFGLYSSDAVVIEAECKDETSPVKSIEYIEVNDVTAYTEEQLENADFEWKEFSSLTMDKDEKFVIYLKVTDYAGQVSYISSDGYIIDTQKAKITISPEETDIYHEYETSKVGIYNDDVDVQIDVKDIDSTGNYSGIQKVEYWVTKDGEKTKEEVLYEFDYVRDAGENSNGGKLKITEWYPDGVRETTYEKNTPEYELLQSEISKTITVNAKENNSCNVVLYVKVTDNAGLETIESIPLDIDVSDPEIQVSFGDDSAIRVETESDGKDRGYFDTDRTATVTITERTAHFESEEATEGIEITGTNGKREQIELDLSKMINGWTTVDTKAADEATHTATVTFDTDANYSFSINYVDKATNENILPIDTKDSVTPYDFTVDKAEPYGKITVGNLGWWDKLIDKLTFGLWSKITVHVDATAGDKISPIESVDYYKTASTKLLQEADLKEITDWKTFSLDKGFEVKPDEQFTVYLRIIDYAGHVKYISSNGVIVDDTLPVIDGLKPEITINPMQPVNDIYNTTTGIYVKVVDPIEGDAYAGLKEIRYEVYNMDKSQTVPTQSGVLFSFDIENPTYEQLRQQWEAQNAFEVLANEANDSNNIIVKVYAVDNAGNENVEQISMKMDITKPTIHVSYDNNAGDTTFGDGTYFKENRTATIVLTERNFSAEYVDIQITDTHGNRPVISGWTTVEGTGNKNNTTHTAKITYAADGDYTFAVSCKDLAGNENTPVDTGNSLSPYEFTIDKTVPTVSVSFDNNQSLNGNYYDAQRTMTITVHEHNFETSRVKVTLNATDEGSPATIPSVNGWTSSGDTHTAIITFANDALYTFDFAYTDKAGNQAADVTEERFYVDKTKPLLEIYGINDESANNGDGNIGFVMEATDTNFDVFKPVLTAVIRKGNSFITEELDIGVFSTIARGKSYTVTNLDLDGIYRITCTVTDKAGNAYEKVVWYDEDGNPNEENRSGEDTLLSFSVNREGSVYEIHDKTRKVLDDFYVQNVKDDVLIYEINADTLGKYEVTLNDQVLKENVDYKVSKEGGNGSWMKYTYAVSRNLFENEGEYILVVSSQDKAENNAFSDVKEASVHFVVDRTAPIVSISGLANNGSYETEYQKVVLIPTDDGGALKSLIVQTVDDEENIIKELVNLSGVDLLTTLKGNDGKITFEVEKGMYQNIKIICDDAASYENEENVIYEEIITNVTITPNKFLIFWANTMLRNISLLILLMLLCATGYIVCKKRKNK